MTYKQIEASRELRLWIGYLELDTDIRTVMRKKRVVFRVKVEDFLPHE